MVAAESRSCLFSGIRGACAIWSHNIKVNVQHILVVVYVIWQVSKQFGKARLKRLGALGVWRSTVLRGFQTQAAKDTASNAAS